jgi:ribonuclease J
LTSITLYGGVGEIGGNKVLVEDKGTRILLDFGMSFKAKGAFYSPPFLSPKSGGALVELDVLPKIDGLYEFDGSKASVDGVFISHAHLDHYGHVPMLKREIPVYCGETTRTIIEASSKTRQSNFESDIGGMQWRTFRTGKKVNVDSIAVEPIHVDHSVPGAYGFLVHTSSGTIVYTGDFRMHGPRKDMTEEFVEKAAEADPIAILTEGTNLTGAEISSEAEVSDKLSKLVKATKGIVLAEFSKSDTDRLTSFYNAAKNGSRSLAISIRQAYVLKALEKDPNLKLPKLSDKNLTVFRRAKKTFYSWEKEVMNDASVVDSAKLSKMQGETVLAASLVDFEELIEIKPLSGSCYVLSASEPFNEEMEIGFDKLMSWLDHYGIVQYHVHVSGHIMPLQLRDALNKIKAKKIFPIHNEHPELFAKFVSGMKGVVVAEKGTSYKL